jgi:predicted ATPase
MTVENNFFKKHNILLRKAREQRGWTYKDVADQIQLPDSPTVGRWERGISFPRPHYRRALSRIFERSPEELGLVQEKSAVEDSLQAEPIWNVLPPLTSFIGREQEISAVCTLLERTDVRLLTILGPGGIGKTRLSMQVAHEMRDLFADGICFVELAALRDPALVIPTIANTLGIRECRVAATPILELVQITLHDRHLLLLLDNFEQVVTEAPWIEKLLNTCPDLKVIVTSRAMLYLPAERVFPLQPLELPDLNRRLDSQKFTQIASIDLFTQRAQAILPDFQITPDNARTIAEICVRLDGLPLAIELAAARSKLLPPQALLAKLSSSLQILRGHLRTVHERHLTLYNTIKWSYDLLDEQEKWLFCQLSVFSGGCTLAAIEFLVERSQQHTIDVLNTLSSLIDKSLLQQIARSGEPRFKMLATVRDYGLDRLRQDGALGCSQGIHAQFYASFVAMASSQLKGAQQAEWLQCLESDLENLRTALGWLIEERETETALHFCDTFGKFCGLCGHWSEEQRWLQAALELPHTPDSLAIRARVLRRAGHLAYRLRNLATALNCYEESVTLARQSGDKENLAGALSGLAWTLYRQSNAASVAHLLEESVRAARESGDLWALANALESQGRFMHTQGKSSMALLLVEESMTLIRTLADRESLARILTTQVCIEMARGNIVRAEALAQESFTIAQQLGTRPLIALVLDCLGDLAQLRGDYEQATKLFTERIELAQEFGDKPTIAFKQLHLAEIALAQSKLSQASTLAQECLKFFRQQGDTPHLAAALHVLADIKRTRKEFTLAAELYKEALLLDKTVGNRRNIGKHVIGLAKVALESGSPEYAASLFGCAECWLNPDVDLQPVQRASHAQSITHLRALLGKTDFEIAWNKGQEITLEQVLSV